jgi:hypothetical protein
MSYEHGAGCCCYECDSRKEKDIRDQVQGVYYESTGNGHSAGCSCWSCDSYRKKRINDIRGY